MNYLKNNHENPSLNLTNVSNTLKMLVLALAFTLSAAVSASTDPSNTNTEEPTTVTKTVGELLKNPTIDLQYDANATVFLTINSENELVVLSVDSENENVKSFIKGRLNYKKLDENFSSKLKSFKVPVKILAK